MLDFTYSNITKIVFGRGAEEHAGKEAAAWGKKVLLHYGGGHIVRTGLKDRVTASLQEAGLESWSSAVFRSRLSLVRQALRWHVRSGWMILAVGGEVWSFRPSIAIGVPYEGSLWVFMQERPSERPYPWVWS